MHLWTKWCWIWWGRAKHHNKYTKTTTDWKEKRNWTALRWTGFSFDPTLSCLAHMFSGKQRGHINIHTRVYTHSHTHVHPHTHYIAQCALISSVDTRGHFSLSFQCSDSDKLQLSSCQTHTHTHTPHTHTHTHVHWKVPVGLKVNRHVPKFWKNTFQKG